MLSGDLNFIEGDKVKIIIDEIHGVEKMLKSLIKPLANNHLNP